MSAAAAGALMRQCILRPMDRENGDMTPATDDPGLSLTKRLKERNPAAIECPAL